MCYADAMSPGFRMGDIVRGFVLSAAKQSRPMTTPHDYQLSVRNPAFAVILTPCCSIKEGTVALAPLAEITAQWLKNPYFQNDLTNINRTMNAEQALPPGKWGELSEDERRKRLQAGPAYALHNWFVFSPHPLLPSYPLRVGGADVQISHYATDFRAIHRVECQSIGDPKMNPADAKCLELTPAVRGELRVKLAHYFGRVPEEDKS